MNCPVCDDIRMREVMKEDVMIDVCPQCKGVWLDRGELEKLMKGVRELQEDYGRMEQHYMSQQSQMQPPPIQQAPPTPQPQNYSNHNQSYPNQGYNNQGYGNYGNGKDGYYKDGKYHKGYPYKKKKTVFDVFGDLFD